MTKFSKTAKKTRMTTERSSIPTQRHNFHNEDRMVNRTRQ